MTSLDYAKRNAAQLYHLPNLACLNNYGRQPYACDGEFKITSSCPPNLNRYVVAILGTSFIVDHFVVALPPIKFLRVVILKINYDQENSCDLNDHLELLLSKKITLYCRKICFHILRT